MDGSGTTGFRRVDVNKNLLLAIAVALVCVPLLAFAAAYLSEWNGYWHYLKVFFR